MSCSTPGPHTPHVTACNMPTSGPHQCTRTAVKPWPTNMFLTPLGVVSQPLLTALQLDVSALSCTQPKLARSLASSGAITQPRLILSAPAQWLQVPHHPGCNVQGPGTLPGPEEVPGPEESLDLERPGTRAATSPPWPPPRLAGFQAQIQTSTGSFECKSAPTCPFLRFPSATPPSHPALTHSMRWGARPRKPGGEACVGGLIRHGNCTPGLCPTVRQSHPALLHPSKRSHTYASW